MRYAHGYILCFMCRFSPRQSGALSFIVRGFVALRVQNREQDIKIILMLIVVRQASAVALDRPVPGGDSDAIFRNLP
jgi:hypothetical protein